MMQVGAGAEGAVGVGTGESEFNELMLLLGIQMCV